MRSRQHGRGPATRTATLRPAALIWTLVALGVFVAGLSVLLWVTIGSSAHQTGALGEATPAPAPRVTVTAQPEAAVSDATGPEIAAGGIEPTEGTDPITAAPVPESDTSSAAGEPLVLVGIGVDLDQHSLDDPASPWVIVNKARPVTPQSWRPEGLQSVGAAQLVPEAAAAFEQLIEGAAAQNLQVQASTAYRSFRLQSSLYNDYSRDYGTEGADRFSARPGHSEHQTGWAVDVYDSHQCRLKECFAQEPAGEWVMAHAHEYGFVVRYPQDAEHITGYRFEPWHLRYVGAELATAMYDHGILTLEEVFDLPPAPNYP